MGHRRFRIEPGRIIENTDRDRHRVATVFDGISKEVLEDLTQPNLVGLNPDVRLGVQRRILLIDVVPTREHEFVE